MISLYFKWLSILFIFSACISDPALAKRNDKAANNAGDSSAGAAPSTPDNTDENDDLQMPDTGTPNAGTPDTGTPDTEGTDTGTDDGSSDNSDNSDGNAPAPDQNMAPSNAPNNNVPPFMTPPPPAQPVECFGIVGAGQNDNVFVGEDGRQYGYGEAPACHPQGSVKLPPDNPQSCENITVGQTEKGELIRGSLKPNPSRRSPKICYPYDFVNKQITYMNPKYATPLE